MGELMLNEDAKGSLEFLFVGFLSRSMNADCAVGTGCIVEASLGQGVVSPAIAVELDEVSTVSLCESPNNVVGGLHI